jgi:exodeoxyribonuclease V alpha subunit
MTTGAPGSTSARAQGETSFSCTIDFILFPRPPKTSENGYTIAKAIHEGTGEQITIKGPFGPVVEGELIKIARGVWREDNYGEHFIVWARSHDDPTTRDALLRYLGELPGVGPAIAAAVIDTLGTDCLAKIDADPRLLLTVRSRGGRKLSEEALEGMAGKWDELRADRRNLLYLSSLGFGDATAKRISAHFGKECQAKMKADPYSITEIDGIGFQVADVAARKLGIGPTDPRRLAAGVEFVLQRAEGDGHICLPRSLLLERAPRTLRMPGHAQTERLLDKAIDRMVGEGRLWSEERDGTERVYTTEMYVIETRLYEHLEAILSQIPDPEAIPSYIKAPAGSILTDEQYQAVWRSREYPFSLLTGGAGCGKTLSTRELIADAEARGLSYCCLAPTGKAAKRMAEATGRKAMTIHRRLGWSGRETPKMMAGPGRPDGDEIFGEDLVIVDEASMLDMRLAERLLSHLRPEAKLVFVGDPNQLPAVGAGSVLLDLIESERVPRTHLTKVFRQQVDGKDAASLLLVNGKRIREGQEPYWSREEAEALIRAGASDPDHDVWNWVPEGTEVIQDDFRFTEVTGRNAEEMEERAVETVLRLSQEAAGELDVTPEDVFITSPTRMGGAGTYALNEALAKERNPDGLKFRDGTNGLRVGDRVMNTKNRYGKMDPETGEVDPDIMNGEIGVVASHDARTKTTVVLFEDGELKYASDELEHLIPAYACTTHKLQGSEAPAIICPYVPSSGQHMLSRNLIYTAITRAKGLAHVVGSKDIIRQGVAKDGSQRNTTLDLRVGAIPKIVAARRKAVYSRGVRSVQQLFGKYAEESVGEDQDLTPLGEAEGLGQAASA